ncbi:MAG: hypothetical protein ACQEXQ_16320 [Bacillota bacterium]
MPGSTKRLVTDGGQIPAPQYYNKTTDSYEFQEGANGAPFVHLTGDLTDFTTAAITVTGAATELTAALANRNKLIVYPPSVGTIYWGTSGVTAANGAPLSAGDLPVEFSFANTALKVYAVSDGTNRSVRVVDSK